MLVAQATLRKARFFASKARETPPIQRDDFAAYLEAAIVFSRSVTFHLQKELSIKPGFTSWYQEWQAKLAASPVARYLLEQRNYVLKEGPTKTRRVVSASIGAAIEFNVAFSASVIRGRPWYKRRLKILIEDLLTPIRAWFADRAERARIRAALLQAKKLEAASSGGVVNDQVYFSAEDLPDLPAADILDQHLSQLSSMVSDAEKRFGGPPAGVA